MRVCNAFSINMVQFDDLRLPMAPVISPLTVTEAREWVAAEGSESCIGHADTAAVLGSVLGVDLPMNRTTVTLDDGAAILVGQYVGPRLPEGTTTLPEGAKVEWFRVEMFSLHRLAEAVK